MPHECTNCGRVFADGSKEMLSGCPDCGGNKFQFRPAAATSSDPADRPEDADRRRSPDESSGSAGDQRHSSPESGSKSQSSTGSRAWPDHGLSGDSTTDSSSQSTRTEESGSSAARSDSHAADPADVEDAADSTHTAEAAEPQKPSGTDDAVQNPPATDDVVEDPAQANARTDVVSPDEIAAASPDGTDRSETAGSPESEPGLGDAEQPPSEEDGRVIEPTSDERPDLDDLREELNDQFESIRIVAPGEYELNLMELYDRTEYIISLQEDGRYVIEVPDTWDTTPDPDET